MGRVGERQGQNAAHSAGGGDRLQLQRGGGENTQGWGRFNGSPSGLLKINGCTEGTGGRGKPTACTGGSGTVF